MEIKEIYNRKWGMPILENFDEVNGDILLIFNFDFTTDFKVDICLHFVIGRIYWIGIHYPNSNKITSIFDIRGQDIIMHRSNQIKAKILKRLEELNFLITTNIEFFR